MRWILYYKRYKQRKKHFSKTRFEISRQKSMRNVTQTMRCPLMKEILDTF